MFDFAPASQGLYELLQDTLTALRPPERVSLSQFAQKNVWVNNASTAGRQRLDFTKTPYQVEPLDALSDPDCQGVRMVAPSRAGKTYMSILLAAHTVETNPMDIMIVPPSRSTATTFAKDDLEKFFEENEWFAAKVRPGRTNNSLLMKKFRNGTILSIVWPSSKNLAGVNRGVVCLPDYDRVKADIDGEGSVYNQADARTKIYGSRKTVFVESSPSKNPEKFERFEPTSPHQAPPYPGIFSLYNEGDRRWWYWRCVCCQQWFPAHPDHLVYDDEGTPKQRAASARVLCPNKECVGPDGNRTEYRHDGDPETGMPGKHELNAGGRWVPDGMSLDENGELIGEMLNPPMPGVMNYKSYWLFGVAAAFQSWESMVLARLNAEQVYQDTGDDTQLKTVLNTDFGLPWIPPHISEAKDFETLKERAEAYPKDVVPEGALYLIVTVDCQKYRWEVQTHAIGPQGRMWIIDRQVVRSSDRDHETRKNADGTPEKAYVQPGQHAEDWEKLTQRLKKLSYRTHDGSGVMVPMFFACDSAGEGATTEHAYEWWRGLNDPAVPRGRVLLIKGDDGLKPLTEIKNPDGRKRTSRSAGGRGDVPVLFVSSNAVKDILAANLDRQVDGPGFIRLPKWAPDSWFKEMVSERRKGEKWVKISEKAPNEAWDLTAYAIAVNMCEKVRAHLIDWSSANLPSYALPAAQNPFVSPVVVLGAAPVPRAAAAPSPYLSYEEIGRQFQELSIG